ncbi:MAG: FG-GAP repeat domain-containing protein, partial [Terriglobia bacterium]
AQPSRQASKRIGAAAPPVVAVGDFNGDGKMDVVLARPFSHSILIFFGADGGILGAQTTYVIKGRVAGMATADFDRDGTSDLAVAAAGRIIILLAGKQMGFRRRQEIELPGVSTISAGDLNGDGKADLIASAGDPASIFVLWGSGDGTFSFPQPVSGAAMRLGPQASWLGR